MPFRTTIQQGWLGFAALVVLTIGLTPAPPGARAEAAAAASPIDDLSDCIDDAIAYTRVRNQNGRLELTCGGAPARRFYDWLGPFARTHQDRTGDGLSSVREFGPNSCSAMVEDSSARRLDSPVFRCDLRLDVGEILGK